MAEVIIDNTQPHLGGNNVSLNRHTFAPEAWTHIIQKYNILYKYITCHTIL